MAWPTADQVIEFFSLDSTYEEQIAEICTWTQDLIEAYLGRVLLEASFTQDSYQPRTNQIQLDNFPALTVDKVTFDSVEQELSDFTLMKRTGQVYGDFTSVDMLEIEYTGGFTDLPNVIVDVFMNIVNDRFNELAGENDNDIKDVTLFDFAKVSYDTSGSSSGGSINYSGVGSGNVPEPLGDYLGMLDLYKSSAVLLGSEGVG